MKQARRIYGEARHVRIGCVVREVYQSAPSARENHEKDLSTFGPAYIDIAVRFIDGHGQSVLQRIP
jgi:hypothetical protein